MSVQIQYLRGSNVQLDAFTGAQAEIVVNTTDYTLRVMDGSTVGGWEVVGNTQVQTLTNKTLVSPIISGVVSLPGNITMGNTFANGYYWSNGTPFTSFSQTDLNNYLRGNVVVDIIPFANVTYSLGNATNQWKDLWISNSTIYMNSIPISLASGNILTVAGVNVVPQSSNLVITSGGLTATGAISGASIAANTAAISGNVTLGNIITGNLSAVTLNASGNLTANNIVSVNGISGELTTPAQPYITQIGTLASLSVTGTLTGNVITSTTIGGTLTTNVQPNITAVGTLSNLTVAGNIASTSGNVSGGNIITAGAVNSATATVTGNITGGNLLTSGAANVGTLTSAGNITATGNVAGGNIYTNGAFWLGNAQPILTASGNLTVGAINSGDITSSGNVNAASINYANGQPIINANGNLTITNLDLSGYVSAGGNIVSTANINGAFFNGNGFYLTGVQAANSVYANVALQVSQANQPNITSVGTLTSLDVLGTVTATNFVGNISGASQFAGTVTNNAQPNITSVGILTSLTSSGAMIADTISADTIGNTGATIIGDTVSAAQIGNAGTLVTGTLTTAAQPNITSVGTLTSLGVTGGVTALSFTGSGAALTSLTGANVTGTVANAAYSTQAGQANFANTATVAGTVTTSAQPNITSTGVLTSLSVTGNIDFTSAGNLNASGNVVVGAGSVFYGDGGGLSNVRGAQITGTVANAAYSLQANQSQNANLALQADNANTAGTVTTNAQPNITSVGTLTSLSVVGDVSAATLTGSLTTAAQPNITSVGTLTSLDVTGAVTAASFEGDGSALTALTGANVTGVVAQATQSQNANLALQANNANVAVVAGTVTTAAQPNITSVGTLSTLSVTGNITGGAGLTLTGNITANNVQAADFFYANGIQVGNYANSNVQLLTNSGLAANVMPSVTNTYTLGNAAVRWQSVDANVGTFTTANASQINASNVSFGTNGIYIAGNLISSASNAITIDPANDGGTNGNLVVLGNVQVTGTLTYANATSALTDNLVWQAANNAATASLASGGGLAVGPAGSSYATFLYNFGSNVWQSNLPLQAGNFIGDGSKLSSINGSNVSGLVPQAIQTQTANLALQANNANTAGTVTVGAQPNITSVGTLTSLDVTGQIDAGSFTGDGGYLGNIISANVVGFVANATLASTANVAYSVDGANVLGFVANATLASTANVASVAYSVAGANVTGTVALATVAGTVSTAAQPNITSVGTLSSLAVTGNINTASSVNAAFFVGDGSQLTNLNVAAIGTVANATNAVNSTYATNLAGGSSLRIPYQSASGTTAFIPAPVTTTTFLQYDGTNLVWASPTVTSLTYNATFINDGTGAVSPSTYNASANVIVSYNTIGAAAANGVNAIGTWTINTAGYAGTVSSNAQPNITSVGNLVSLTVNTSVTANTFVGSGALLANINGSNVTGYVPNANNAVVAQSATIAGTAFQASVVTSGAQPNITSVGTLTGLTLSGNLVGTNAALTGTANIGTIVCDNFAYSNGQPIFGSTGTVSAGNINASGAIVATGNTTAANFNTTGVANVGTLTTTGNATVGSGLTVTGTTTLTGTTTASTINAASVGNAGTTFTGASLSAAQIGNAGTLLTGTLQTAAQTNITSVGTLTGLTLSGGIIGTTVSAATIGNAGALLQGANVTVTGDITTSGGAFVGAGTGLTGTATGLTAGATQAAVTFNTSGGAAAGTTFNGGTARTIDASTVGAPYGNGTGATGTWSVNTTGYAATVSTAAQPNITSLGTVTGLTTSGVIQASAGGINLGVVGTPFATVYGTTFSGVSTTAKYADLAESYVGDHNYEPGTVVAFGGTKEVTQSEVDGDRRVAGVVSTNPAYLMNSELHDPNTVAVALTGRVPCKVTGTVRKGDLMVSNGDGTARAEADPKSGSIIGKALADFDGVTGTIEVVVGRF